MLLPLKLFWSSTEAHPVQICSAARVAAFVLLFNVGGFQWRVLGQNLGDLQS